MDTRTGAGQRQLGDKRRIPNGRINCSGMMNLRDALRRIMGKLGDMERGTKVGDKIEGWSRVVRPNQVGRERIQWHADPMEAITKETESLLAKNG
jgi:hypothetical protein